MLAMMRNIGIMLCLVLGSVSAAHAHGGASGVVKERMDGMLSIAREFKTIGEMVQGKSDFDAGAVGLSAAQIGAHSGKISHQFPADSFVSPSDARKSILDDWAAFLIFADTLTIASNELAEAAPGLTDVEMLKPHFSAIAKNCSGCHKSFRN